MSVYSLSLHLGWTAFVSNQGNKTAFGERFSKLICADVPSSKSSSRGCDESSGGANIRFAEKLTAKAAAEELYLEHLMRQPLHFQRQE